MKVVCLTAVLLLASCPGSAATAKAGKVAAESRLAANPIRKVVTMLQNMQKKITAEGHKKEELYDKFMCYCQNGDEALKKSIADAEDKIVQLEKLIGSGAAEKKQLEADVKKAKEDRADAKKAIEEATALREKEAKAYAKVKADSEANLGALSKAIPAIEKGMAGAFLQTSAASVLRQLSVSAEMNAADRDTLASFLSNGEGYVPQSGQIVGILKQMQDEMSKDFEEATEAENAAITAYEELVAAKKKEIDSLTKQIETKSARIGELAVKLAGAENELEDTKEGMADDKKFLADLEKNCELKKKEWAEYKAVQAQEMVALADTIKILNDDDALELFKKTLPGASSFVQVKVTSKAVLLQASKVLKASKKADPRLDLIELAMHGQKNGFEKIIKMIDELVVDLGKEQQADTDKKQYCLTELDQAEDKKKGLDLDIGDLDKAIADAEETIAQLKNEIEALEDGIKALDKSVAEATEQRKEEHDDYVETLAQNNAAKDLLAFAKNRLNKFYNPKLYKPPPKRELSEEDRIVVNMGGTLAPTAAPGGIAGTGVTALSQVAPPPPPEANLAYKKSGEESNGVLAMIDLLVADIDKDNQVSGVEEKDAQKDYEAFMADAAAKRAADSKSITDKQALKADTESQLQTDQESKKSKETEAMETAQYIGELHADCDWLLKYFDARKAARDGEIASLGKAKDVLAGADYSLVQESSSHLRGSLRA